MFRGFVDEERFAEQNLEEKQNCLDSTWWWWYGAERAPELNASFVLINHGQNWNGWKEILYMELPQMKESKATNRASNLPFFLLQVRMKAPRS